MTTNKMEKVLKKKKEILWATMFSMVKGMPTSFRKNGVTFSF